VLRPTAPRLELVNADEIERLANLAGEGIDSYVAAERAAARRSELIAAGRSFITETVFSHRSKVELLETAIDAGYVVSLHVLIIPLAVAIARVGERAAHGGHDVPRQKMTERYARLWDVIAEAIALATEATVWDSSGFSTFDKVASFTRGRLAGGARWPRWTPEALRRV
jgi:predicted ABC-type ATPase